MEAVRPAGFDQLLGAEHEQFTRGDVADYQMSALAMASSGETRALARFRDEIMDRVLSELPSTRGVGRLRAVLVARGASARFASPDVFPENPGRILFEVARS